MSHVTLEYIGAGVLYVVMLWGLISGVRSIVSKNESRWAPELGASTVFMIYFGTVILSVARPVLTYLWSGL